MQNLNTKECVIKPRQGLLGLDLVEIWEFRDLLFALISRNLQARYKQSVLGVSWVVLRPLLTMMIFTVLFGKIAKFPSDGIGYAIFVFLGLIPWSYFSGSLSGGTSSLTGNSGLISKIYFPRLILPLSSNISNMIDLGISFFVLLVLMAVYNVAFQIQSLFIPFLILGFCVSSLGPALFFGALNVKYRDVGQAISFVVQIWMYLTPVIYPLSFIPEKYRFYLYLNPMAGYIDTFRYCVTGRGDFNGAGLTLSVTVSIILLVMGVVYFRQTERTFADVI